MPKAPTKNPSKQTLANRRWAAKNPLKHLQIIKASNQKWNQWHAIRKVFLNILIEN